MKKFWMWLLVLVAVTWLPVQAGKTSEAARGVSNMCTQALQQIAGEDGPQAALRSSIAQQIVASLLNQFNKDSSVTSFDSRLFLLDVASARGKALKGLDELDLAQCYADNHANLAQYSAAVKKMATLQHRQINWKNPAVQQSLRNVFVACQNIAEAQKGAVVSGRYSTANCNGEVRLVWYPTDASMYIFAVASLPKSLGIKNAVFNMVGRVNSNYSAKKTQHVVKLQRYQLQLGNRQQDYQSQHTSTNVNLPGTSEAFIVNSTLRVKTDGFKITGRLTETCVACNRSNAEPLTVIYLLNGTLQDSGEISGRVEVLGQPESLRTRFGNTAGLSGASFSGTLSSSLVKGVIKAEGTEAIPWQANRK